jgi:ATP-dependent Lon protease
MECLVFPLTHTNLFPLTTKPLNIFEAKYLKMIEDSIEKEIPIALGYVPENGDTYRSTAGYGTPQIIDRRPNGSLLVFLVGLGKVKLGKEIQSADSPYIICETEKISEDLNLDDELKSKYVILSQVLVKWVQKHIPEPAQREIFIRNLKGPQEIIGSFASYLIRDYDLQYEMMEILSLNEQIKYLHRLFESNELTND